MRIEEMPVEGGSFALPDYEKAVATFRWQDAEQAFSWATTGKVNVAYEAIDRHAESARGEKVALYYEDANRKERFTFRQMKQLTNKAANVLRAHSTLAAGDRAFLFMPRSPELYIALLGALKIGAVVGPLFEAFMEGAVSDRLEDSAAKVLVTTPELLPRIPLERLSALEKVFVVGGVPDDRKADGRLIDFDREIAAASDRFEIAWLGREDPMLLHYTSGSTGRPKGILHVCDAMIQHYQTFKWTMDIREGDVYWCTADPGWVTGTSYGIFGPWLNGTTSVVLGGRFSPEAWYRALETYGVTVWYSAPTAFRMLMGAGGTPAKQYDLSQLRHILSVGEPLNPEVIKWGKEAFGLRIHDTWWMTETGGHMIVNFPALPIRPGSMGKPFPGIEASIVDNRGVELPPYQMGNLAIRKGWPAMMRAVWNNPKKYESYFLNGEWYVSGDSAYRDEEGYFWFQGRVDDVIMTAGERIGPFEVESKLIEHPAVLEAGVIGKPDPVRGEIVKAFVALRDGIEPTEALKEEIRAFVKQGLAAHAAPREIEFRDKLPKTRSGKIMRRVLKSWELGLPAGDLSTMEE